jgi:hypothetical protein
MAGGPERRRPRRRAAGPDAGPRPLSEGIDEAVRRLVPADPSPGAPPSSGTLAAVFSRWEEIAGPSVARHVRPLRVSGGVLLVAVDQPAWATQVRSLSRHLLDRVAEVSGEAPDRLQVTVRPLDGPPGSQPDGGAVE